MELYLLDWANLLLRWLHVVVAIAWIGASFYFVWLDNHLTPPQDDDLKARGVDGELWAVHGGGFYNPQKYRVGPRRMPAGTLHWFYWESYATWLSGFALFVVLYLWNAGTFLVDKTRLDWPPAAAGGAALAFLVVGWLVYDALCRVFGRHPDGTIGNDGRVLGLLLVFVVAATWLACRLFPGRGAFLVIGAMLGTLMTANVAHWIIPGQRKVVADLRAGRPPDPVHGQRGKQRSVHNTYLTLPVLVAMLSNHYAMLYQHPHNWAVLCLLMLVGALVRQFFVLRHQGRRRWDLVAASVALLVVLAVWLAPAGGGAAPGQPGVPRLGQVQAIVQARCVACHNEQLQNKGVALHTAAHTLRHAQAIHQQVVLQKLMPLNNATGMTDEERALLGRWVQAGAPPD
jgi:uncharacterized membrane protein